MPKENNATNAADQHHTQTGEILGEQYSNLMLSTAAYLDAQSMPRQPSLIRPTTRMVLYHACLPFSGSHWVYLPDESTRRQAALSSSTCLNP